MSPKQKLQNNEKALSTTEYRTQAVPWSVVGVSKTDGPLFVCVLKLFRKNAVQMRP